LYRQKGTGNARAGDIKSPLRRSGGTIFGPRPRKYSLKVNHKASQLARRSALAYKAKNEAIRVVEDFSFDSPDTNEIMAMLAALELGNSKVLLLTSGHEANVYRSGRNIPRFKVMEASQISTVDVLDAQTLLLQEGALASLSNLLGGK
jgi:large subunit ribosomal protein L4